MARDYNKLHVFHLAHQQVIDVYRLTAALPTSERYGLQGQLRRAAASVPCNTVEGCVRQSTPDYLRFLDFALGSASEVHYLLGLTGDLGLLDGEDFVRCRTCSGHVVRALQKLHTAVGALAKSREATLGAGVWAGSGPSLKPIARSP